MRARHIVVFMLLLGAASCAQILGDDFQIEDDDDDGSSSGNQDCHATCDCNDCGVCACGGELNACNANGDCFPFTDCYYACAGDSTCIDDCYNVYGGGADAAIALDVCLTEQCYAECVDGSCGS